MNNQQIRKNRQRIRKDIKACFVIPSTEQNLPKETIDIKKIEQENMPKKRSKRKTSEDIRIFDDINYLKEIYISNSFSDLFQLGDKIGQGAQSTVYKCKQLATGDIYAVKVIKNKQAQLTRTLKQQFRVLKSIDHQNVIKAFYLFINENQSTSHMVCQYVQSPALRDYMKKKKVLKETQIAQIVSQLFGTLSQLHKKGICHRDIKPQNILYNQVSGVLKLIDFQISKMAKYGHQRLSMATPTGTLAYKAPEMFGGQYNQLVDVWAVGVLAYEMAFKKLPFWNQYSDKLIRMIQQDTPQYNQTIATPMLIQFIEKLLTKNPIERISAAEAFKTPFLLKYSSLTSSSSPKLKKNGSQQEKQQNKKKKLSKLQKHFSFGLNKCYDEDSQINGKQQFSEDIGIRLCSHSMRDVK